MLRGAFSRLLGGHAASVDHPYYLINGRTSVDPTQFKAKPGERIRLRIINAGAETAFRVALGTASSPSPTATAFPYGTTRSTRCSWAWPSGTTCSSP
ncbi:hypothetical protein ACR6C2_05970 [Streptomyces sp. INA 01156]